MVLLASLADIAPACFLETALTPVESILDGGSVRMVQLSMSWQSLKKSSGIILSKLIGLSEKSNSGLPPHPSISDTGLIWDVVALLGCISKTRRRFGVRHWQEPDCGKYICLGTGEYPGTRCNRPEVVA